MRPTYLLALLTCVGLLTSAYALTMAGSAHEAATTSYACEAGRVPVEMSKGAITCLVGQVAAEGAECGAGTVPVRTWGGPPACVEGMPARKERKSL